MRKINYVMLVVVIIVAYLSVGCSSSKSASPTETAKNYFAALKEAKYNEAQDYLSTTLKNKLEAAGVHTGMTMKTVSDDLKRRQFDRAEIIKEYINNDQAMVRLKLIFKDNKSGETLELKLVKEEKEWKLDNSKKI